MKKEELYKVIDILNDVLSNYLRGSEAEEVIAKLEESVEYSELIKEEPQVKESAEIQHVKEACKENGGSLTQETVREDYKIYGSVAAVKALDRKRVCPQLKGNTLHKFKNEFNTIKQIVHLLYDYNNTFCYRVALHWAYWGAYNLKSFGNINEKEKAKMDISEEPVSEDFRTALEEKVREAQDWTFIEEEGGECPLNEEFGAYDLEEFARWGANWQKQQDKQWLAEEHKNIFAKGRESMKQQMMKDAMEGIVTDERSYSSYEIDEIDITVDYNKDTTPFTVEDKVKLIIIKEE